jgi:phosphatidylserine/phosphatidylglycerophosphate/cardiolipin synthase-like enzyme
MMDNHKFVNSDKQKTSPNKSPLRGGRSTPREIPTHWGSWKGQIIEAIVKNGLLDWNELQRVTGLDNRDLNTALSELYNLRQIRKIARGKYRLCPELLQEYSEFLARQKPPEKDDKTTMDEQPRKTTVDTGSETVNWIKEWKQLRKLDFSLDSKHFFLDDMDLDDLSKQLIRRASKEALVVNPFIESCSLSKTLEEASKHGAKVTVITRPPREDDQREQEKREYHSKLEQEEINLVYNRETHAKLIVVDNEAAIVSSMNFYSGSSGGKTWEAGLVSIDENVVKSVVNAIHKLQTSSERSHKPVTYRRY